MYIMIKGLNSCLSHSFLNIAFSSLVIVIKTYKAI